MINRWSSEDAIIACSSGLHHNVAISVIRLSGFQNLDFLGPHISLNPKKIRPRFSHFVKLLDSGVVLDEVLLFFYPGPNSYNGENILELNVHGNILNVERIINLFVKNGFRYADPGEFTYRALKNKKLSLSQVEGLDLFLNASSPMALEQGFSLLNGELQKSYEELHKSFLSHRAALELGIDFLEDIGEEAFDRNFKRTLDDLQNKLFFFKSRIQSQDINLLSPEIVLLGRPNAGKSTFFNKILQFERSIVSDEAGTTRDYVSERINIEGVIYALVDTAGLRETTNKIEASGIQKSQEKAESAFFRVLLVNPFDEDLKELKEYLKFSLDLIIFTHSDVDGFLERVSELLPLFGPIEPMSSAGPIEPNLILADGPIEPNFESGPIEPELALGSIGAKYCFLESYNEKSVGYEDFRALLSLKYASISKESPILLERQKYSLQEILSVFENYKQISLSESDISILASELNILGHCISELIGIISPDDVLQDIFSNFCIGK